ncbi:2-hydroxychromene-2-carboxylate isomerase [Amorphus suaedae]
MTAQPIEFYFDFISPFGYFASLRIDDLAARHGRTADWSSMLVGVSILKVMGLKPIPQTPLKGEYARRDAERYCRRHGIALGRSLGQPPANPLPAGRTFHWLKTHDPDRAKPIARALLDAYWVKDVDIGALETVLDIASDCGADRALLADAHAGREAADLLRVAVDASLAKGVFGSPFVIVDGEPFFGVEKLELMEEWLATGGW